jgi:hypothetical protein
VRLDHLLSREIRVRTAYGEVLALMAPRLIARSLAFPAEWNAPAQAGGRPRLGETPYRARSSALFLPLFKGYGAAARRASGVAGCSEGV